MFVLYVISTTLCGPQEQEEMIKRHQGELRQLHQKLDMYTDTSLDRFKQTAMVFTVLFWGVFFIQLKQLRVFALTPCCIPLVTHVRWLENRLEEWSYVSANV